MRDIYKLILSYEKDDSAFRIEGQSTSMQEKMLLQRRMRCYFKICYINIHLCMHHQRNFYLHLDIHHHSHYLSIRHML